MKTTKILAVSAAVCALLTGCLKNEILPQDDGEKFNLNVTVSTGDATKASGVASAEDAIKTVQVFVFSASGILETEKYANSTENLNLVCTKGQKQIKVVVNNSQISGIKTLTGLESVTSALLDNTVDNLVMANLTPVPVDVNGPDVSVEVEVKRLVSKIIIKNIHNKISLAQYQNSALNISSIYLINVAGNCTFGENDFYPSIWHNKSGRVDALPNICYEYIDELLIYNQSLTNEYFFYAYPNPHNEDSNASEWSPRHTRLVVECKLEGRVYYYPITLPVLQSNTVYTIENLTITRLGLNNPDVTEVFGSASFSVTVAEWSETTLSDVII